MILVSSCLLGLETKYNGAANYSQILSEYSHLEKYIPICPEQLGGLPTPRECAEICGGSGEEVLEGHKKVISLSGQDYTNNFIKGANEVVKFLHIFPVTSAILKEKSPSCGCNKIYDGTFSGIVKQGMGVTASILKKHGIPIYSENELTSELLQKLLWQ